MFYKYATCESAYGLIIKHVFIEFVASAMRYFMRNQRVVVYMLLLIGYHTTIALTLGSLTREGKVELIAGNTIMEGDDIVVHTTIGLLVDVDIAHADVLGVRLFEAIQIQ